MHLDYFWFRMLSFGDVCLLSFKMEQDGAWLTVLKVPIKIHVNNVTAMCLSTNHDLVTSDNPQIFL